MKLELPLPLLGHAMEWHYVSWYRCAALLQVFSRFAAPGLSVFACAFADLLNRLLPRLHRPLTVRVLSQLTNAGLPCPNCDKFSRHSVKVEFRLLELSDGLVWTMLFVESSAAFASASNWLDEV